MQISVNSRRLIAKLHPDNFSHPHLKAEVLRKGGLGIQGTYNNIAHHANGMEEYVDRIAAVIPSMGLKRWRQGHNVHVFETRDDRIFEMIPVKCAGDYCGVRLNMRLGRGNHILIAQVSDQDDIEGFITTLRYVFALPLPGTHTHRDNADCN